MVLHRPAEPAAFTGQMDFAPRPTPQTNFTDYADICARNAKSQDCKIWCKNRAMDLMIIIFSATYCKQAR
jgi:hypothetical protein